MVFEKAQWIWLKHPASDVNEYADFTAAFPARTDGKTTLRICSKSDYACFLNGRFIGFNQFPDFPDRKVYDEYDISEYLVKGENLLAVLALSKNYDTSSHIKNGKGIIFEIESGGETILASDAHVSSRLSATYRSGPVPLVTGQLGMSFAYDFNGTDGWTETGRGRLTESVVSDRKGNFVPDP
ncbi:MAG: hypothetical protein ACLRSW_03435 [Christensenellaceae bacterium]